MCILFASINIYFCREHRPLPMPPSGVAHVSTVQCWHAHHPLPIVLLYCDRPLKNSDFVLKSPILVDLSQNEGKKYNFFENFFSKRLHGKDFCITFASAFENERNLKQNELSSC